MYSFVIPNHASSEIFCNRVAEVYLLFRERFCIREWGATLQVLCHCKSRESVPYHNCSVGMYTYSIACTRTKRLALCPWLYHCATKVFGDLIAVIGGSN